MSSRRNLYTAALRVVKYEDARCFSVLGDERKRKTLARVGKTFPGSFFQTIKPLRQTFTALNSNALTLN